MGSNRCRAPLLLSVAGLALAAGFGCRAGGPQGMIAWELARPADLAAAPQWRSRLSREQTIPAELTERLCEEFDLVQIHSAGEWDRLCRAVTLEGQAPLRRPDFLRGSVVGIIARVGQPANDAWPVTLEEVRLADRSGWIRFRFAPGLYYPTSSPAFFVATYVPGLKDTRVVQINKRIFAIAGPPRAAGSPEREAPVNVSAGPKGREAAPSQTPVVPERT